MTASARERRLARGVASGNRQALRLVYEEYWGQLYTAAYRLTKSSADARDVLQDVFFRLPDALRSFDLRRPLGPWLRAVTVRAALRHLRSQRRRREVSMEAVPRGPRVEASPESAVLDGVMIERALSSLPEELRIVVVLKVMEGFSHQEIAELLGVSRSTSEGRLYRARKLLRATLLER